MEIWVGGGVKRERRGAPSYTISISREALAPSALFTAEITE